LQALQEGKPFDFTVLAIRRSPTLIAFGDDPLAEKQSFYLLFQFISIYFFFAYI
jgi:hypothetical protein